MENCNICDNGERLHFTTTSSGHLKRKFVELKNPKIVEHSSIFGAVCSACGRQKVWIEK